MKENKIKVARIDENTLEIDYKVIDDTLSAYYRETNCECIQFITLARLPYHEYGKIVAIIDDNGKLRGRKPTMLLWGSDGKLIDFIVGDVILARSYDYDDELHSLELEDIFTVADNIIASLELRNEIFSTR